MLHPTVHKARTRIVDFDSSDDDDERMEEEKGSGWEEEATSLEKTLDSLGLESEERGRRVRLTEAPAIQTPRDSAGPNQDRSG